MFFNYILEYDAGVLHYNAPVDKTIDNSDWLDAIYSSLKDKGFPMVLSGLIKQTFTTPLDSQPLSQCTIIARDAIVAHVSHRRAAELAEKALIPFNENYLTALTPNGLKLLHGLSLANLNQRLSEEHITHIATELMDIPYASDRVVELVSNGVLLDLTGRGTKPLYGVISLLTHTGRGSLSATVVKAIENYIAENAVC